jgi:uncharacterized protein YggU (UPF0235/DUF167 family)
VGSHLPPDPLTRLVVRVTPRAGRTAITGVQTAPPRGAREPRAPEAFLLLVKLAAAPVDGAANDALVCLLSAALNVRKRDIRIVSGERSRTKHVEVHGADAAHVRRRLDEALKD